MDKTNAPTNASGLPRAAPIAGAIVLVAFGLGLVGYLEAGGASIATAVYDTLELFTLTFVVPRGAHGTSLPVVLEIARFLAPAVTVRLPGWSVIAGGRLTVSVTEELVAEFTEFVATQRN